MAPSSKSAIDHDDAPLKRLGGGRWQTRDERFTIEPQSGTWVVVDGEQTDDLGMALVRGPFPSLTAAKDAIASARSSAPAASPLAGRIERRRRDPSREASPEPRATRDPTRHAETARTRSRAGGESPAEPESRAKAAATSTPSRARRTGRGADQAPEPGWLTDLEPAERGRARRLIAGLRDDGVVDAEGLVRRDIVGGVPALAAAAIGGRLAKLGADATPNDIAELLADGRDDRLGVRWRLVDGDGRPILLETAARRRR